VDRVCQLHLRSGADIEGFAKIGEVYTYAKHGFEATEYPLETDQLGMT